MKKVMIVDHSSATRNHLASIVLRQKYEVVAQAADGREALLYYERDKPDLVIMDLVLPEMSGYVTVRKLLELDPRAQIIICSALAHRKVIMEMIQAGVSDYIVKPFLDEHIIMALEKQFM